MQEIAEGLRYSLISMKREDLREWEKKLQEGEDRLAKGQRVLNEKEHRANETDQICQQKEKDLQEAYKNIDATNGTLFEDLQFILYSQLVGI